MRGCADNPQSCCVASALLESSSNLADNASMFSLRSFTIVMIPVAAFAMSMGCGGVSESSTSEEIDDRSATGGANGGGSTSSTGGVSNSSSGGTADTGGSPQSLFADQLRFSEGSCLPRELPSDSTGMIPCEVVEVSKAAGSCTDRGRLALAPSVALAALQYMEEKGFCGENAPVDCAESFFLCGIVQLEGAERETCLSDAADPETFQASGFCYIDDPESPLVDDCDVTQKRQLRMVGQDVPVAGSVIVLVCGGE